MAEVLTRFDTHHRGPLHSIAYNTYGTCLATASSDHTIRLFNVSNPVQSPLMIQELCGHQGPVWQVSWAHPKFGNIFASCGYDKRVLIWQQQMAQNQGGHYNRNESQGSYVCVYENCEHQASVNCIEFAPQEYNLMLSAGSTDGSISVYVHDNTSQWMRKSFPAHFNGVNSICWAPARYAAGGSFHKEDNQAPLLPPLIASGGCDSRVRIWTVNMSTMDLQEAGTLPSAHQHTDWVRGVAFQPIPPSSFLTPSGLILASCGEDKCVKIWVGQLDNKKSNQSVYEWTHLQTICFDAPVWNISWSVSGTLLCCACGDDSVIVLRENTNGIWECISDVKDMLTNEQANAQNNGVLDNTMAHVSGSPHMMPTSGTPMMHAQGTPMMHPQGTPMMHPQSTPMMQSNQNMGQQMPGGMHGMPPTSGQMHNMPPQSSNPMPPSSGMMHNMPPSGGGMHNMPPPSGQMHNMPPSSGQMHNMPPPSGQMHNMPPPSGQMHNMPPSSGQMHNMPPPSGQMHNMPPSSGTMHSRPPMGQMPPMSTGQMPMPPMGQVHNRPPTDMQGGQMNMSPSRMPNMPSNGPPPAWSAYPTPAQRPY